MYQALSRIKIIDLSRLMTGPFCTMLLADMGADVIKVEAPDMGDETRQWGARVGTEGTYFLSVNRNKKALTLNLKHPEGKEILRRLISDADVLIENFRPGTMDRLDLGYAQLAQINPKLIYCAVSGFGLTGPYRDKPGYDLLAQAMGGLMSLTGEEGRPPVKAGMSVADIGSGMFAAIGILAALQARQITGRGQLVETSLLDTIVSWQTYLATAYWATGSVPQKAGSAHPSIVPYQALKAKDEYFIVAVGNETLWLKFCEALGCPRLAHDERFATNRQRVTHRESLIPLLEEILEAEPAAYWVNRLETVGVPAGPINRLDQVWSDPQVLSRELMIQIEDQSGLRMKLPGFPIKFSDSPLTVRSAPPRLGEHSAEILCSMGYSDSEIAILKEKAII